LFLTFDQRWQGTVYHVIEFPDDAFLEKPKHLVKIKQYQRGCN